MAGKYEIDTGGNRGSLLTVILGNVLWTLKLQELVNQGVLWNVFASVFSRLSELTCRFGPSATAHGRAPPRHGRGDSLGFVSHSLIDLN